LSYINHLFDNNVQKTIFLFYTGLLTSALDGGKWSASYCSYFTPRESTLVHRGLGVTPEPVWIIWSTEKSLAHATD